MSVASLRTGLEVLRVGSPTIDGVELHEEGDGVSGEAFGLSFYARRRQILVVVSGSDGRNRVSGAVVDKTD